MLGSKIASSIAHGFHTGTIAVGQKLSNHRPASQHFFNHLGSPEALKLLSGWIFASWLMTSSALKRRVISHSFYSLEIRVHASD